MLNGTQYSHDLAHNFSALPFYLYTALGFS